MVQKKRCARVQAAQLELGLSRNWGGKRRGAGRKASAGRGMVAHEKRPVHRAGEPVHVTMRSEMRPLRHPFVFPTVRGAIEGANARAEARGREFRIVHFSVQSDHLHLIVEAGDQRALSAGLRGLAVSLARQLNRLVSRRGRVIADRWHGHALSTPRAVRNAIGYVLGNFRKHCARATEDLDVYSSAPHFSGFAEAFGMEPILLNPKLLLRAFGRRDAPIRSPSTWLLREGWLRHGPISMFERPRG